MLKDCICQCWQRYNTFAYARITQYMHQIACIYIVVCQQKCNNTCLETTYKLEGEILQTSVFKMENWLWLIRAKKSK